MLQGASKPSFAIRPSGPMAKEGLDFLSPKDVDAMLHQIIEQHSDHDAKEMVKQLRREKRYLRDVY